MASVVEGNSEGTAVVPTTQCVFDRNKAFEELLSSFPEAVLSWTRVFPLLMSHLVMLGQHATRKAARLTKGLKDALEKGEENATVLADFTRLKNRANTVSEMQLVMLRLPEVVLSALITEYDLLLAAVYRTVLECAPDVLKSSKKAPDFAEIFKLGDMDAVRRLAMDREIDDFGRKSRMDQIDKLTELTKLKFRDYLPDFPDFVEVAERRNLFVHNNGIVNEQYLANCRAAGMKLDKDCAIGTRLLANSEYMSKAAVALIFTGIVVTYLLWRKFASDEGVAAESELNDVGYQLIFKRRYDLAVAVLNFGCNSVKAHTTDRTHRMMIINLCNALRLSGKKAGAIEILEKVDWSSSAIEFSLANQLIREDFASAAKTMREIGSKSEKVTRGAYHEWPLFRGFRETQEFKDAYNDLFDEPYTGDPPAEEADKLDKFFEQYFNEMKDTFEEIKEGMKKQKEEAGTE